MQWRMERVKRFIVDIGNRNMKVGFKEGEEFKKYKFQHIFKIQPIVDHSVEEVVEWEGNLYSFNKGKYDNEFNKTKKNFIPALLKGIASKTNESEIELMLACPCDQIAGRRAVFKEMLEDKEFKFKYRDKEREIKIGRVGVIGEGFATFFKLPKETRKNKNIGIIDIGGRTVNVATFKKGTMDNMKSYNYGALDLKEEILSIEKLSGDDIDLLEVEERIQMGKINIDKNTQVNFLNNLINDMKLNKIRLDMFDWYITGGGSVDLEEGIQEVFVDITKVEDPIMSNLEGMYNFANAKWGEE